VKQAKLGPYFFFTKSDFDLLGCVWLREEIEMRERGEKEYEKRERDEK